jgi:SanA protein
MRSDLAIVCAFDAGPKHSGVREQNSGPAADIDRAGGLSDHRRRASQVRRWLRRLVYAGAFAFVLGNLWIVVRAHGRVFANVADVPATDVALVLGTSARLKSGGENRFFAGRMAAAAELYRTGKIRHLILSGDNREARYDEPTTMREAPVKLGVPADAITLDYAGFRTLDSFARAKKVFGVDRVTIVTDDFHCPRAVLLARHFGIDAYAYHSKPVPMRWSTKTRIREIAARFRALLDLYVLRTKPHFLGPRIHLPTQ